MNSDNDITCRAMRDAFNVGSSHSNLEGAVLNVQRRRGCACDDFARGIAAFALRYARIGAKPGGRRQHCRWHRRRWRVIGRNRGRIAMFRTTRRMPGIHALVAASHRLGRFLRRVSARRADIGCRRQLIEQQAEHDQRHALQARATMGKLADVKYHGTKPKPGIRSCHCAQRQQRGKIPAAGTRPHQSWKNCRR